MLTFKPGGWFSGDSDLHCVEGFIMDKDKRKLAFLYGKWTESLCSVTQIILYPVTQIILYPVTQIILYSVTQIILYPLQGLL